MIKQLKRMEKELTFNITVLKQFSLLYIFMTEHSVKSSLKTPHFLSHFFRVGSCCKYDGLRGLLTGVRWTVRGQVVSDH